MKALSKDDFTKIVDILTDKINKEYPGDYNPVKIIGTIAIDVCNRFFQEYEKMKSE